MSKYNAKKVTIDDIVFDSKVEGEYYKLLKQQKEDRLIKDFELQPEFILQPKFEKDGKKYLPIKYQADFKVFKNDGTTDIVDVKGQVLPLFKLKEKMFHYQYDFPLILMCYSKIDGGWIHHSALEKARKERKKAKEAKSK